MKTNEKMLLKILFTMGLIIICVSSIYSVNAGGAESESSGISLQEMEQQARDFITKGQTQAEESGIQPGEIAGQFVEIGKILTMVGAGVLVAVTTYMGIKYLTSGPEAQAKLKVQLIGIVVSGMVIFGAYTIWSIVVDIASQF